MKTTLGDADKAIDALWEALKGDPNDLHLLSAWIDSHQKRWGDRGALVAFQKASLLPNPWLAKIWSTRFLLEQGRLEESLNLYREALATAPRRSLAVQEISGHLGQAGYYEESIALLLPLYSPIDHGPYAGFNLFNACEDAHDYDSAQQVLDKMKTVRWPDEPFNAIVQIRQEKLDLLRGLPGENPLAN